MLTAMTKLLDSSGVSDDHMKTEEFGDYKRNDPGTGVTRLDSTS